MTGPLSPRSLRGAIVGVDPFNPLASVIAFQYNPDTLQRTLQPQGSEGGEGAAKAEALRLKGPPVETIKVEVEIDATDQLAAGDPRAQGLGIHAQLAALEMLLYPKSALVIANTVLLAIGTIEVIAPSSPLTLFVWGPKRVLPVRLTEFSVTEEAHDASLNPIRAKVSLGLRVLTYADLPISNPGYALFLAHQIGKEAMAVIGSGGALTDVVGGDVSLF
jgi:hypothetical protein